MAATGIGCLPRMAGHGFPIIPGDGRPFTMAVGCTILITDGCGSRIMNGAPVGFAGEDRRAIMVGRLLNPALVSILPMAMAIVCPIIAGAL